MQVKRSELTALIVSLGGTEKIVRKLDRKKFLFRVGNIPKLEQELDFKVPDGDLGKLYTEVCEAVAAKEKIELLPEDKPVMNGEAPHAKKSAKEGKKPKPAKEPKPVRASKNGDSKSPREGSVSGTILELIQGGPISKEDVWKKLCKKFPDHKPDTLKNTIAWNIATGFPRKGIKVSKDKEGALCAK